MSISEKLTASILRNPLLLQSAMLNQYAEDTGGNTIVDPNNTVAYFLSMSSETTAAAINEVLNTSEGLYPVRAQTSEDLYKHMSDYEYVGLYGAPASCQLSIVLAKTYLMENAIDYNENYSKVVIPRTTTFKVGTYTFGLYYPIEIRINKAAQTFTVIQDTSVDNPLKSLSQNVLEHRFVHDGTMELIFISVPVYQFVRTRFTDAIAATAGFDKRYSYANRFYAVRVFTNILNETSGEYVWGEMQQAISNSIYDPETPTAVISVFEETKQVRVTIPQVYLTESKVQGTVRIEVYATEGALEYTIPITEEDTFASMAFSLEELSDDDAVYSAPLRQSPVMAVYPLSTVVTGGSNGYDFATLRYNVINDTFGDNTPITPGDIEAFFKKNGFTVTKYLDGLLDRVFLCHQKITDGNGSVVAAAAMNTYFTASSAANSPGVNAHNASLYTFLPSAIYEFDEDKTACNILSTTELIRISKLSALDRVAEFNSRSLTISPFHVQLDVSGTTPFATAYDLMDPKVVVNEFIGENTDIGTQLSLYSYSVAPYENGTKGFDFTFVISRTDNIKDLIARTEGGIQNIRVLVATTNIYQKTIWAEAEYIGRSDDKDVFVLHLESAYQMTQVDGVHAVWINDTFTDSSNELNHAIYLTSDFSIVLALRDSVLTVEEGTARVIKTDLPGGWTDYVAVAEQAMEIKLGEPISALFNKVSLAFKGNEYVKYATTKFSTLKDPIYARDAETGSISYEIVGDKVQLTEAYPAGTLSMVAAGLTPTCTLSSSTASQASATYHPVDMADMTGLSNANVVWSAITALGTVTIAVQDALKTVLDYCPSILGKASLPATAAAGTFVWVVDARVINGEEVDIDTPIYGMVVTDSEAVANGRLYLKTEDAWVAMVGGASIADTLSAISTANTEGEYFGYTYRIAVAGEAIPLHISFLTKRPAVELDAPLAGTETNYPSFQSKTEEEDLISWSNFIDQWPWDAEIWSSLVTSEFTADNATKTMYAIVTDPNVELNLVSASAIPYCEYVSGQIKLDGDRNPIIDEAATAEIVYLVQMIHLDAKLMMGTVSAYSDYPEPTRDLLRSYFTTTMDVATNQLMERTRLFFEPLRSLGYGTYKNAAGQSLEMSLDITIAFRVYVAAASVSDSELIDLVKSTIVSIIDEQISEGTVSCIEIAKLLQAKMPDTIEMVDILGINGDSNLQTLIFSDTFTRPHLKHQLELLEDGTIDISRGLNLEVVSVS